MAETPRTSGSPNLRQDLANLVRAVRLRLEDEARAGLAAVQRPAALEPAVGLSAEASAKAEAAGHAPRASATAGATPAPLPEARAAEAMKRELAGRAGPPEEPPAVHVAGPGLFDLASPDLEEGMTREEAISRVVAEVAACERCPELVANRTRTVPGQGSLYAKLLFIGEGPGEEEDRQGLAFVGRAGQLLTKMIESIGLAREEVFIANILKCRPPNNRQPTPEEAAHCAPYLARQVAILRPKVIVALGGVAAQNLLQTHDGITRLRGRFYPYRGAKLMPTFHPAYVLRNYTPDTRKKVYDDLLKVRAELDA